MFEFTHQYEARIIVNNIPITEYQHTDGNTYVEGRSGSRYELEFKNLSSERIMVVPSVDGLSVFDGNAAGLDSGGYVLEAQGSIRVPGWRLDKDKVAEFLFGDIRDSYNARSNNEAGNIGVIGFLVFREYPQPHIWNQPWYNPWWNGYYTYTDSWQNVAGTPGLGLGVSGGGFNPAGGSVSMPAIWSGNNSWPSSLNITTTVPLSTTAGMNVISSHNAAPASAGGAAPVLTESVTKSSTGPSNMQMTQQTVQSEVGTGFGQETSFKTYDITFTKRDAQHPDGIMAIYYDSMRSLERKGIVARPKGGLLPKAFTNLQANKNPSGCTPPTGWRK
jgi:hypothetical protein